MQNRYLVHLKIIYFFISIAPAYAGATECNFKPHICLAQKSIFAISSFAPIASATRIGPQTLVTSRHSVGDHRSVKIHLPGGSIINAEVIPTDFPEDLILLKAETLPKGPQIPFGNAKANEIVRVIAIDLNKKRVKTYKPGSVIFLPSPNQATSRLHHTAYSQPGNSGGALINSKGEFVGIVSSGGEGRYEAIPIKRVSTLKKRSGKPFQKSSDQIGFAVKKCTLLLEEIEYTKKSKIRRETADTLKKICLESKNRQLYDLAASTLGRYSFLTRSIKLFQRSILTDENAVNSRLGLIVSLSVSKKYKLAAPHIRWLLKQGIYDPQVLRLGIQTGVWGGDKGLAMEAFSVLKKTNPKLVPMVEKFLKNAYSKTKNAD